MFSHRHQCANQCCVVKHSREGTAILNSKAAHIVDIVRLAYISLKFHINTTHLIIPLGHHFQNSPTLPLPPTRLRPSPVPSIPTPPLTLTPPRTRPRPIVTALALVVGPQAAVPHPVAGGGEGLPQFIVLRAVRQADAVDWVPEVRIVSGRVPAGRLGRVPRQVRAARVQRV